MKKKSRTISNMVAKFDTAVVEAMLSRLKDPKVKATRFYLEDVFQRIAKRCKGRRVTWTDIKQYNLEHGEKLTAEQKLDLHDRSFRNS